MEPNQIDKKYLINGTYNLFIKKLVESRAFIIWQYRLWSLKFRNTKLQRVLPKNQHTQRKLLNFENFELSEIGHHFSNKVI